MFGDKACAHRSLANLLDEAIISEKAAFFHKYILFFVLIDELLHLLQCPTVLIPAFGFVKQALCKFWVIYPERVVDVKRNFKALKLYIFIKYCIDYEGNDLFSF